MRGDDGMNRTSLNTRSFGKERPARSGRKRDGAALALLLFAGLNINGVLLLVFGTQGLMSPLVLLLVLVCWSRYARVSALGESFLWFVLFFGSYLSFASFVSLGQPHFDTYYVQFYVSTMLFILGVYFWLAACTDDEFKGALTAFKVILVLSCVFVPLSPYLAFYIPYTRPEDRASGLFDNPGEASSVALYCLVLVTAYPSSRRLITFIQVGIALLALAMTFSKTGMITLVVLSALLVIKRRSIILLIGLAAIALAGAVMLNYALQNDLLQLNEDQSQRLADVMNVLGGEIDRRTTTGRTGLWELGMRQINENLPWGAGLGSFHALEGGARVKGISGQWLGVHNTYLMILGEAGLFPFLIFLGWMLRSLMVGLRSREQMVAVGFLVVFLTDIFSIHNGLLLRVPNIALAILMAIMARNAIRVPGVSNLGFPDTQSARRTGHGDGLRRPPRGGGGPRDAGGEAYGPT